MKMFLTNVFALLRKNSITLVLFLLLSPWQICFAQSVLSPSLMEVYMAVTPNDTSNLWSSTEFDSLTHLTSTMVVVLQDTVNISFIDIKLGTTDGGTDLRQKSFIYSTAGNFSDGTSLKREGNIVTLGLGSFVGVNTYYGEVVLRNSTGNSSAVYKYNNL